MSEETKLKIRIIIPFILTFLSIFFIPREMDYMTRRSLVGFVLFVSIAVLWGPTLIKFQYKLFKFKRAKTKYSDKVNDR